MTLDTATRGFVDRLGIWFELGRLPRIAGQILGLLLVSREPRSMDDITAMLEVSKASVSSNARLLERMRMIHRVALPGDRRDYYSIAEDLEARILEFRLGLMREMRDILGAGLQTCGAEDATVRTRLTQAAESLGEAIEDLASRAERIKAALANGNERAALQRAG